MSNPAGAIMHSAIVQAFLGAGIAAFVIHAVTGLEYQWVFAAGGRDGGTGVVVAAVFLGILGYRLGQQLIVATRKS
jgi:hypothetical protein